MKEAALISGVSAQETEEIWIEGEALQAYLAPVRTWGGEAIAPLLDQSKGALLKRYETYVTLSIFFAGESTVSLKKRSAATTGELYAIHVPSVIRFSMGMVDGVLFVKGLADHIDGALPLSFKVKIPWLPDSITIRRFWVNMIDGSMQLEAGILRNRVVVVARAHIMAKKFEGIDFWETLRRNFGGGIHEGIVWEPVY